MVPEPTVAVPVPAGIGSPIRPPRDLNIGGRLQAVSSPLRGNTSSRGGVPPMLGRHHHQQQLTPSFSSGQVLNYVLTKRVCKDMIWATNTLMYFLFFDFSTEMMQMTALYLELQLFTYPAAVTDLLKQLVLRRFNQEVDLRSAAFLLRMRK